MQSYDLSGKKPSESHNRARSQVFATKVAVTESPWYKLVHDKRFTAVCSFFIILNACLIGAQMDLELRSIIDTRSSYDESAWRAVEILFAIIFAVELVLRVIANKSLFVFGEEWKWNMFDLVIVAQSLVELSLGREGLPNVTYARSLRVLRFIRILRIIRVMRFFQSFRLMIFSIMNSLLSLLWVFLVLFFVMYLFGIFLIHGTIEFLKREEVDRSHADDLILNYGALPEAMLSLFAAICGGKDWLELFDPLFKIDPLYGMIFIAYIFFVVFGVLNVVVGAFVDSAYQTSQRDRDYLVSCEVDKNKLYMDNIRTFFYEADQDQSGVLSLEEFEAHLKQDRVKAYFQALELDVSQARALFLLLDVDETDKVDLEEFIGGCMRMKGDAKSIDVNMLLYENEKMIAKWNAFMVFCEDKFERLEVAVGCARAQSKFGEGTGPAPGELLGQRRGSGNGQPRTPTQGQAGDKLQHLQRVVPTLATAEPLQ